MATQAKPGTSHELADRFRAVRRLSLDIAAPLSEADACLQPFADASPAKWHLAHTTWFFDVFVLERFEAGYKPSHPSYRMIFNSYYNAIGPQHARPQRGHLSRPGVAEIRAYRSQVTERVATLLSTLEGQARAALV